MGEAGVPEEPKDGEAPKKDEAPKAPESPWTGFLKAAGDKLVPLLVSAIVSVGFVAFAGKAVLWTRFKALQVPPDQVVKAVPQGEAVAIGASMLLIFGLLGLLATLGVYLVDRGGRATPGMSRGLLAILAIEAGVAIWFVDAGVEPRIIASEVLLLGLGAIFWSTFVAGLITHEPEVPDLEGDEEVQEIAPRAFYREGGKSGIEPIGLLVSLAAAAIAGGIGYLVAFVIDGSSNVGWIVAIPTAGLALLAAVVMHWARFRLDEAAKAKKKKEKEARRKEKEETKKYKKKAKKKAEREARKAKKRKKPDEEERRKPPGFALTFWGVLLMVLLTIAIVVVPSLILHEWWLAVALGSVAILGGALWRISSFSRKRFVWYGLAVFISVPLFGTVMLMARNVDEPQVQPMALIRSTDGPDEAIQGLYVTETSDRVYFANVATEGCEDKLEHNSGRLLWVPNKEVVAMAIGPLQSVHDAGKAALEMSYALTPATETQAGDNGSLTTAEQRSLKAEALASPTKLDQRLENAGPAVRPNFGYGLSLVPESASPGEEVALRMSVPNENGEVDGFGDSPESRVLRLNGIRLAVLRETAPSAGEAEYVRTDDKTVLSLDKEGVYGKREEGGFFSLKGRPFYEGRRFVKLEDSRVVHISHDGDEDSGNYLEVEGSDELVGEPKVTLEAGGEPVPLEDRFLRQAWNKNEIRFRVPDKAASGVVTVECDQLAGQPLLRVTHAPTARIAVRMRANSAGVVLNSSRSSDEDKSEKISRRWKIDGLRRGHAKKIDTQLPPRLGAYSVELTVTDEAGNTDTAKLQLLRLPTSLFGVDRTKPKGSTSAIEAVRKSLEKAVEAEPPVEVELDGHADNPGSIAHNLKLSLERDREMRGMLLREPKKVPEGERVVPVEELAYGEGCPIDPRPGSRPRNRRVDLFLIDEGVTVKPAKGCHPGHLESTHWYPPPRPSLSPSGLRPVDAQAAKSAGA